MEVLLELTTGKNNYEIALSLTIVRRLSTHITNILTMLHLSNRTQAAVLAWEEGIVRRDK